jgi:amidase
MVGKSKFSWPSKRFVLTPRLISTTGQEAVLSVLGPMTSSVDGLRVFMQAIAAGRPWALDPTTLRLAWQDDRYHLSDHGGEKGQLCFAIMWDDGYCRPQVPYTRALHETRAALVAQGHAGKYLRELAAGSFPM